MEINRNQYFMMGLVVLALGIQFRVVETFVLNEPATQFVRERWKEKKKQEGDVAAVALATAAPVFKPRHPITPPVWVGWSFISVGSVLVLHSLAMKKPGG